MNRFARLALLPALAPWALAHAADGELDPAFGTGGIVRMDEIQPEYPAVAVQPDGRILLCDAKHGEPGTGYNFYVVRLDPDGTRDTTFGTGGALMIPFELPDYGDDFCHGIAIEADGHIVVAGARMLSSFPDPIRWDIAVARINADGTLDAAFGSDGRLEFLFDGYTYGGIATSVAIDAEDRIVVAGAVQSADFGRRIGIARIESDGSFDATFGIGGQATIPAQMGDDGGTANAVAIDADGRIFVACGHGTGGELARLLPDGSPDATFGDGGIAAAGLDGAGGSGSLVALAIDAEDRPVAAGYRWRNDGDYGKDTIAVRFLSDGSRDATFGDGGIAAVTFDLGLEQGDQSEASALAIEPDGKIVLVGGAVQNFPAGGLATVARLDARGALDPTFGQDGKATFDVSAFPRGEQWLSGVAMQGARIVAVGGNVDVEDGREGDIVLRLIADRIFGDAFD